MSGSWSVPRILRRSGPGFAGTWIGALAPARTDNGPFIQVGTNEQRRPGTAALKAADGYYAFWSDATARLHTIGLFAVRPGDRVSASLTDGRDGWTVMIVDHTSGARARFFTSEEAGARFNYAIWNEEDVTNGHVDRLFAYPSAMSLVRFSQLAVDGRPPSQSRLKETTLVENGRRLIPTRLIDDSFAMTDATSRLKRVTKHRERG